MNIAFQPLSEELVSSACALSTQAGWEQTSEDWRRLTRLPSSGVWVWAEEGVVRGSFSVAAMGAELAWIGMVLVHKDSRGRGAGKAVFQGALSEARARNFTVLGLDATDMGEPIYRKAGFETIGPIERWRGALQADARPGKNIRTGLHDGIENLDRRAAQVDRTLFLRDLACSGGTFLSIVDGGGTVAYAVLRPSRTATYLGPVVAGSPDDFAQLLDAAADFANGGDVICDVLREGAHSHLRSRGMEPLRHLKRMTLPLKRHCLSGDAIWCGAGFEVG